MGLNVSVLPAKSCVLSVLYTCANGVFGGFRLIAALLRPTGLAVGLNAWSLFAACSAPLGTIRAHQDVEGLRGSVAVGATAGQDAQHLDDAGAVALEAHAPVPYAQAPLVLNTSELDDVTGRGITGETIERIGGSSRWRSRLARPVKTQPPLGPFKRTRGGCLQPR